MCLIKIFSHKRFNSIESTIYASNDLGKKIGKIEQSEKSNTELMMEHDSPVNSCEKITFSE